MICEGCAYVDSVTFTSEEPFVLCVKRNLVVDHTLSSCDLYAPTYTSRTSSMIKIDEFDDHLYPAKGVKHDERKPRFSLLPWREVTDVVRVLTYGAEKYPSDDNWKHVDNAPDRYLSATLRHITTWAAGERNDNESGLSHLAHAICCLLFLMWFGNEDDETPAEGEQNER